MEPPDPTPMTVLGPIAEWPILPLPVVAEPLKGHVGVRLREWRAADAGQLSAAWADPDVRRWTSPPPEPSEALAASWISGERERRARGLALDVVIAVAGPEADDAGVVVGEIGLSSFNAKRRAVLVGYWLAPSHRGSGFASAALAQVAGWAGMHLGVQHLLAQCDVGNAASIAVAQRAGFATLPRREPGAAPQDQVILGLQPQPPSPG